MSDVVVRQASQQDLPTIKSLLRAASLGYDDVEEHIAGFLVAEVKGTIAGTIGLEVHANVGLLRSAAVSVEFQGKGVGGVLVEVLIEKARSAGLHQLVLLTTTAEDYFRRRGFSKIRRETVTGEVRSSKQFTGACPSSATVMRMDL